MNAWEYRQKKIEEMDAQDIQIRATINIHFEALFELAELLEEAIKDKRPIRIETPFGEYIFHPNLVVFKEFKKG